MGGFIEKGPCLSFWLRGEGVNKRGGLIERELTKALTVNVIKNFENMVYSNYIVLSLHQS